MFRASVHVCKKVNRCLINLSIRSLIAFFWSISLWLSGSWRLKSESYSMDERARAAYSDHVTVSPELGAGLHLFSRRPLLQLWLTDEMTSLKPADGCLAPGVILSLSFLVSVPVSLLNWPLACLALISFCEEVWQKREPDSWQRGQRWRRESEESGEVASCCSICFESDEPTQFLTSCPAGSFNSRSVELLACLYMLSLIRPEL